MEVTMWSTTDFRKGLKLEIDGEPFVIVDFQHVKPGKGGAFVRTRIKSMTSGRVLDKTYRSGEKVDKADMETCDVQFLYMEGETYIFMNTSSYEQIPMNPDQLGDATKYLKDSMVVELLLHNGNPLSVDLPTFVELEVTKAEPGMKGDTASGAQKPVFLETGLQVNVPLFINEGDVLKIDTRTATYAEKVNK
jgi:elongation factor P